MNETPLPDEVRVLMAKHGFSLDIYSWRWGCPGEDWIDHAALCDIYHAQGIEGVESLLRGIERERDEP